MGRYKREERDHTGGNKSAERRNPRRGSLVDNFAEKVFLEKEKFLQERYYEPGADLEEWRLHWHEDVKAGEAAKVAAGEAQRSGVLEMSGAGLI